MNPTEKTRSISPISCVVLDDGNGKLQVEFHDGGTATLSRDGQFLGLCRWHVNGVGNRFDRVVIESPHPILR